MRERERNVFIGNSTSWITNIHGVKYKIQVNSNRHRGRSGRIAHLTFIRIKNILNANPSIGNLPHGKLRYVYLV